MEKANGALIVVFSGGDVVAEGILNEKPVKGVASALAVVVIGFGKPKLIVVVDSLLAVVVVDSLLAVVVVVDFVKLKVGNDELVVGG
jgi:hypothetical protein